MQCADIPKKHVIIKHDCMKPIRGNLDPIDTEDDLDEVLDDLKRIKSMQRAQSMQLKHYSLNIIQEEETCSSNLELPLIYDESSFSQSIGTMS